MYLSGCKLNLEYWILSWVFKPPSQIDEMKCWLTLPTASAQAASDMLVWSQGALLLGRSKPSSNRLGLKDVAKVAKVANHMLFPCETQFEILNRITQQCRWWNINMVLILYLVITVAAVLLDYFKFVLHHAMLNVSHTLNGWHAMCVHYVYRRCVRKVVLNGFLSFLKHLSISHAFHNGRGSPVCDQCDSAAPCVLPSVGQCGHYM